MTALKRVIQVIVLYTRDRENTVLEVPERKEGGDMNKMGKEFFSPSHQPRGIEEEQHRLIQTKAARLRGYFIQLVCSEEVLVVG